MTRRRDQIVVGYRPKTGFPTDANGNLKLEFIYGPAPVEQSPDRERDRSTRQSLLL